VRAPVDDPQATASNLRAISDEEVPELAPSNSMLLQVSGDAAQVDDEAAEAAGGLGPPLDLDRLPDIGAPLDDESGAAPFRTNEGGAADAVPAEEPTVPPPARGLPPLRPSKSFHRDLSPSQRVAALTDAIDESVSGAHQLPEDTGTLDLPRGPTGVAPAPQPSSFTTHGLGPSSPGSPADDEDAPFTLPDTGIVVLVPDKPIEEKPLASGEAPQAPPAAAARYRSGGSSHELAPIAPRRRPNVAGGHGVAARVDEAPSKSKLWIAFVAGSLALVALVLLLYRHFH
jgi:hypothetical protein